MKCFNVICKSFVMVTVGAAGLLLPSLSAADDDVWKTAASGSWFAGLSWVDGSPPDSTSDSATFNLAGDYTVSFGSDPAPIGELSIFNAANVTFASSARPGNPIEPRTLTLVDTGGSQGNLGVGFDASLTLGATSGGFPSSSHPFHVTAERLGYSGTLNVRFGSDVTVAEIFDQGHLNVTGAGSTVTVTDRLSVFKGAMDVTLGGSVQSVSALAGGAVTVSGVGSRWMNSGILQIGKADTTGQIHGTLSVTGGGLVEGVSATLGDQFGTTGTVTVTDSGSLWKNTGVLRIGGAGPGTLNVQPGGTVSAMSETVISAQGRLRLQGGTFDTGELRVENGGQFEWTSGTLHVGMHHGDLSFAIGTLAPGHSAGSTTVLGNYTQQSNGILEIELGGAAQGTQYDVVNVTGNAQLGGQLDLKLISGFVPSPSHSFVVLSANIVGGAFSNVANGQRLSTDGGGSFRVNYGPGSAFDPNLVVLSAFQAGPSGDFDGDGDVDGADFLTWQRGGSPNPNSTADLAAWRANFGSSPLTVASDAVPEQEVMGLAAYGLTYLGFYLRLTQQQNRR